MFCLALPLRSRTTLYATAAPWIHVKTTSLEPTLVPMIGRRQQHYLQPSAWHDGKHERFVFPLQTWSSSSSSPSPSSSWCSFHTTAVLAFPSPSQQLRVRQRKQERQQQQIAAINDDDEYRHNHDTDSKSARSTFREVPVIPSILAYIQRVGVGIPKRNRNPKRRLRTQRQRQSSLRDDIVDSSNSMDRNRSVVMSRQEEFQAFAAQQNHHGRRRRSSPRTTTHGSATTTATTTTTTTTTAATKFTTMSKPMPPLPFGHKKSNPKRIRTKPRNENDMDDTVQSVVKILGSVGAAPSAENANNNTNGDDDRTTLDDDFPRPSLRIPEVAIIGRSNVGKSTLLNALLYGEEETEDEVVMALNDRVGKHDANTNKHNRNRKRRKSLTTQTAKLPKGIKAATSSRPGETRRITFYQLSARQNLPKNNEAGEPSEEDDVKPSFIKKQQRSYSLLLVDLPGYGFAYGPSTEDDSGHSSSSSGAPWQSPLIECYLLNRPRSSLKRILLLLDARHGMKKSDVEFLESLQEKAMMRESAHDIASGQRKHHRGKTVDLPPIQIVLTKCDLVTQADLARQIVLVQTQLSDCLRRQLGALPVMMVSAQMEGQAGLLELQRELAALVVG